jgi:hypothetical protein
MDEKRIELLEERMKRLEDTNRTIYECLIELLNKYLDKNKKSPTDKFYDDLNAVEKHIAKELLKKHGDKS